MNNQVRKISYRTKGFGQGPITRLMSPGDLGEVVKPFVFLDFFSADTRQGQMPYHPHSGIVTVTTIFEGGMTYEDSTGKSGELITGAVEWMQAGNGVWHTGGPLPKAGNFIRGMQLWLALPAALENMPPESLYIEPSQIPQSGPVKVIIGEYNGMVSPLPQISPITYLHVQLKDGEQWTFDVPATHDVLWLAVDVGSLDVSGATLTREIAVFEESSKSITVTSKGDTNFVVGSALKHPHPLVTGSYSVHTNENDLRIGEAGITKVAQRMRTEGRL